MKRVRNRTVRALREKIDEEKPKPSFWRRVEGEYLLIDELRDGKWRRAGAQGHQAVSVLVKPGEDGEDDKLKPVIDRLQQSPGFWISR